jgi:hypothetical protein
MGNGLEEREQKSIFPYGKKSVIYVSKAKASSLWTSCIKKKE